MAVLSSTVSPRPKYFNGQSGVNRTPDLLIPNQGFYQLNYTLGIPNLIRTSIAHRGVGF